MDTKTLIQPGCIFLKDRPYDEAEFKNIRQALLEKHLRNQMLKENIDVEAKEKQMFYKGLKSLAPKS